MAAPTAVPHAPSPLMQTNHKADVDVPDQGSVQGAVEGSGAETMPALPNPTVPSGNVDGRASAPVCDSVAQATEIFHTPSRLLQDAPSSITTTKRRRDPDTASPEDESDAGDTDPANVVPAFLVKTFEMVSSPEFADCIGWNPDGTGIQILDGEHLAVRVLPEFFRHNNLSSFIRQLNMYGFTKNKVRGANLREFQHAFFLRGRRDLLRYIRRRTNGRGLTEPPPTHCLPASPDSEPASGAASAVQQSSPMASSTVTSRKRALRQDSAETDSLPANPVVRSLAEAVEQMQASIAMLRSDMLMEMEEVRTEIVRARADILRELRGVSGIASMSTEATPVAAPRLVLCHSLDALLDAVSMVSPARPPTQNAP